MKAFAEQIFFGAIIELVSLIMSYVFKDKPRSAIAIFAGGTILAGLIAFTPIVPPDNSTELIIPSSTTEIPKIDIAAETPTITLELPSPTLIPTQLLLDVTGMWDLNFTYKGYTNSNGVFKERSSTENWLVNLTQSGNGVTGELLSVNSNYVDSCINARIEGSINKSDITLLIYFNGSCCPNEIARIDGTIQNDDFIAGSYQPAKIPSGTCILSTGDVIGTKQ